MIAFTSARWSGSAETVFLLDRAMKGGDLKRLVADFNRDWPDVKRTRGSLFLRRNLEVNSDRHLGRAKPQALRTS